MSNFCTHTLSMCCWKIFLSFGIGGKISIMTECFAGENFLQNGPLYWFSHRLPNCRKCLFFSPITLCAWCSLNICHSSQFQGLCSTKSSRETLAMFLEKENPNTFFFVFHIELLSVCYYNGCPGLCRHRLFSDAHSNLRISEGIWEIYLRSILD